MSRISSRLGGLGVLLVAVAALAGAAPAMAAVTTTHITTPSEPTFRQYDADAPGAQTFDVAGTSDGTTGDHVNVRCYIAASGEYNTVADGVEVEADGSFSLPGADLSDCAEWLYRLRAVPDGADADWETFSGPLFGVGLQRLSVNTDAPGGDQLYDYEFKSVTASTFNDYYSASAYAFYDSFLYDSAMNSHPGLWAGVAGLYNGGRDGDPGRSQITLDGHDVYTPGGAYYLNGGAEGLPRMTVSDELDPATGELTIHETDPLVYCGDGAGNIADPATGSPPDCPEFLAAPATLVRTITESQDGRQSWIRDDFSSTDGAAHALETAYDNHLTSVYTRFPNESAYTEHAAGDAPSLAASGPGTIFAEQDPDAPDGLDNVQAAISYLTQPDRAVFVGGGDALQLQYARTIPASGPVSLSHVYMQGFDREVVTASARAVTDGAQGPSVTITSPADNAVVTTDSTAVTGTATDNAGAPSLAVNGLPTSVNPDGTWSQTIAGLVPGPNVITAIAEDAAGNVTQASATVIYSPPVPPVPPVPEPGPGPGPAPAPAPAPGPGPAPAPPSCMVPNVAGMPSGNADTAIESAGCTVGFVTSATSAKVAKGSVVRQSRAAGSKVPVYFPIDIVLSSGKPGKAKAAASATLRGTKLTLRLTCPRSDGNACSGVVAIKLKTKARGRKASLGAHRFSVRAGRSHNVVFALGSRVATTIHQREAVKATVSLKGSATASSRLTIKG